MSLYNPTALEHIRIFITYYCTSLFVLSISARWLWMILSLFSLRIHLHRQLLYCIGCEEIFIHSFILLNRSIYYWFTSATHGRFVNLIFTKPRTIRGRENHDEGNENEWNWITKAAVNAARAWPLHGTPCETIQHKRTRGDNLIGKISNLA